MQSLLNEVQQKKLLALARAVIAQRLGLSAEVFPDDPADPALQVSLATFVTLKISGQLRGCIGNLEAVDTLVESVKRNAVQAAFHDHRFTPLTAAEFGALTIEISVLSKPEPLDYSHGEELRDKLVPGRDGVILQSGRGRATFLPQVWEQLPTAELFLDHLCLKAGVSQDAWREGSVQVACYQVQKFQEKLQ